MIILKDKSSEKHGSSIASSYISSKRRKLRERRTLPEMCLRRRRQVPKEWRRTLPIEPFNMQLDLHLFLQATTIIG